QQPRGRHSCEGHLVLKFAVVREDWQLEAELVRRTRAQAALVVASGGCTALSLGATFPELAVAAFDLNPDQLAQVRAKLSAVSAHDLRELNVGSADRRALNQSGAFEGLFRILRGAFLEMVARGE